MITQVVGWVESSAPHYAAAFAAGAVIAGLALVGAVTVARWVWDRTRDDVLWLAGWAARRRWNRSTGLIPPRPMASVGPIEGRPAERSVRDTFGPVARYGPTALPKREPHPVAQATEAGPDSTDLFDGPSAKHFDQQVEDVLTIANRILRSAETGGAP